MKVTEVENRSGNTEHPYGFVYFSDETRVGYAPGNDGEGPYGLFPSNWGPTTSRHFKLAEEALQELFPELAKE